MIEFIEIKKSPIISNDEKVFDLEVEKDHSFVVGDGLIVHNCLTRRQTGCGRPQLSAIIECADAAHQVGGMVCGDGGITCPGDLGKAFGAGADFRHLHRAAREDCRMPHAQLPEGTDASRSGIEYDRATSPVVDSLDLAARRSGDDAADRERRAGRHAELGDAVGGDRHVPVRVRFHVGGISNENVRSLHEEDVVGWR